MAITHFGNKMLRGTKVDRVVDSLGSSADGTNTGITLVKGGGSVTGSPTTDLSSAIGSWTKSPNSGSYFSVDSGNNEIDVAYGSSADHAISYDLGGGSNLGTKFTVRFEYQITGYSGLGNYMQFAVGLTDGTSSCIRNSSDLFVASNTAGSSLNRWRLHVDHSDQVSGGSGADSLQTMSTTSSATTYYIELTRDGDTFGLTFFTDNTYTTVSESKTGSTSETIDLRYIQASIYQESSGSGTYTSSIRNIKYWNNQARFHGSKLGSGAYECATTTGYVDCGSNSDWNFLHNSSAKFTIAGWYKTPTAWNSTLDLGFICETSAGSSTGAGISLKADHRSGARTLSVEINSTSAQVVSMNITNFFPDDNDWHHIALTYDQSLANTNMIAYVDGVQKGTANKSGNSPSDANSEGALRFGTGVGSHKQYYGKWNFDDFGIYNRVLTATEISDLVNAQNASIGSDGNFTSNSNLTYGETGIVGNAIKGNGSSSYAENGTNTTNFKYIHGVDEKWTINFWFKKTTAETNNTACIMGTCGGGAVVGFRINYLDRTAESETRQLQLNLRSGNGAMYTINNDSFFPNDTNWHMMTITGDNSVTSNSVYVYLDNTQKVTANRSVAGSDTSTQHELNLFREPDGSPYWDGTLDEISLWNRVLTSSERSALYNSGSGAVTTTAVTNHKGLKAYYDMNESSGNIENKVTYSATGALVSSLTNKSELKAHYSMDSTDVNTVSDTATYTEDMSDTTGWAFADTGANNVTGGSLSYSLKRDGSNDAASYDFGATISNKFTLRFSHTPTAQSHSSGSNCIGFFGLSDNTSGQGTSQDFIGFNFASNDSDGATTKNDTTLVANSVTGQASNSHTSGTKYYEIKRNSATEVVFTVYNNSDFTGVYRTQTESSLSSSITGLRYFKFANWHSSGSGSCSVTGTIDDLQLWDHEGCKNDASSTSELDGMTNLPTNTLFLQTDDSPTYWWKQSDNTWKLDGHSNIEPSLTDSSVWSMVGKQTGSATTTLIGGKLRYVQATDHGTSDSGAVAVFDTGGTTDTFVMRFNFTTGGSHDDGGGNANLFWGLSSNGSYSSSQGFNINQGQDAVAFRWHFHSDKTRLGYWNGGSLSWGTDPNESLTFTNNTTYYWELSFDGSTTTLKRFTDDTYKSPAHTGTQTSVSGVSGLRYLVIGGTIDSQMGVFTIDHNKFEIQKGRSTWLE